MTNILDVDYNYFMLSPLILSVLLSANPLVDYTPSFFDTTSEERLNAFNRGLTEGKKKRDWFGVWNRTRKGIGTIKVAPLRSETVSWLSVPTGAQMAYIDGFEAKKKYESDEAIQLQKSKLTEWGKFREETLTVYCDLGLYPSFGGLGGRISRVANIQDLNDVRVVMVVGDKVIQPKSQPGKLTPETGTDQSTATVPGTVRNSDGETVLRYTEHVTESYKWYQASFDVTFDLYDKDGKPIIPETSKGFSFRVIYGANDREAKFTLEEFRNLKKQLCAPVK